MKYVNDNDRFFFLFLYTKLCMHVDLLSRSIKSSNEYAFKYEFTVEPMMPNVRHKV